MKPFWIICLLQVIVSSVGAQQKMLRSSRVSAAPKIDGIIDEDCWKDLDAATDFITNDPVFGNPAAQKTEVKICYDDVALYIAAYMYDHAPDKINTQLTKRDGNGSVDNIAIGLDTYHDGLNAFRFVVSAAGVQTDGKMSANDYDVNWDAVWESQTSEVKDGWVAEIKIPYSALRFPSKPVQEWGCQFARNIVHDGEYVTWSPVDPKKSGAITQWGILTNLKNISPPVRLSFSPYLSVGYQSEPISTDPVAFNQSKTISGGMDVKYGINESFTLDMTVVPDFGQVQSDNVVLNLSPFEIQYDERRQFFTEGTELFNQSVNMMESGKMFYSRRIGGVPAGYYNVQNDLKFNEVIEKNPSVVQLYNATKLTGRTNNGLGIGLLNSVTANMYATIKNTETGETRRYQTDVFTNYNVFVLDQSLKNNSKIGFFNTNVIRDGSAPDANVSRVSFDIKNKKNSYGLSGFANYSTQTGIDGEKNKDGYSYGIAFSKISGLFQFDLGNSIISEDYDQNDFGILYYNNEIQNFAGIRLQNYQPKAKLLFNWSAWVGNSLKLKFQPTQYQEYSVNGGLYLTFKNSWSSGFNFYSQPFDQIDFYEPRVPGMKFIRHPFVYGSVFVNSDYRKPVEFYMSFGYGESPYPEDPYYEIGFAVTWKTNDHLKLSYNLSASKDNSNFGYSHFNDMGQPIMGRRDVYNVTNYLEAQYSFNPYMNVSVRTRYYWSKVLYQEFYNLLDDGNLESFGYEPGYDENFNYFTLDFIYNWEFLPGSRLSFAWKNIIQQGDNHGTDSYSQNFNKTFDSPANNDVSIKCTFYLDYQKLKKKKKV